MKSNPIKNNGGDIFIPASKKKKGSSAYYEFQYCKVKEDSNCSCYTYWAEDSLLMHMNFDEVFFRDYLPFFDNPISPDGSGRFCYFAPNYYNKERSKEILQSLRSHDLPGKEVLIEWLELAVSRYNGFYFLGI